MATLQKTQNVRVCDSCGTDNMVFSHCQNCGHDYCYECGKTNAFTYSHGVNVGGSGDACYCVACKQQLLKANDKRLLAYLKIQDLRAEAERFYADFKNRSDAAEAAVKAFPQPRGMTR
jgi:hypothetical protein